MNPSAQRRKIVILAALLYAASFIFPWFDIRPNRVAAAAAFSLFEGGAPFWLPALLSPAFLILLYQSASPGLHAPALIIQGSIPTALALYVLSTVEIAFASQIGDIGRVGIGFGVYLYILAGLVTVISSGMRSGAIAACLLVIASAVVFFAARGSFQSLGIVMEAVNQRRRLLLEFGNHLRITLTSVGISSVIGIPAAILAFSKKTVRQALFPVINILQTIPSIALFGLMIAPLAALSQALPALREMGIRGIGNAPAIIALSVYGLYPVIRYSFSGLSSIDKKVIGAGRGMGMSERQLWRLIRIPLSTPVILHGIRVALIQTLGNATLAKLIGGDGLGVFVFEGLGQASSDMVLLGMFLIITLTIISDKLLSISIWQLSPPVLRRQLTPGAQHE